MQKPRYDLSDSWYKGNVHLHTNDSDGQKTPRQCAEAYAAAGYDFIAFSDHAGPRYDIAKIAAQQQRVREEKWPLPILGGVELHGSDLEGRFFHVLCLGDVGVPPVEDGLSPAMAYCRDRGCLLILAHPGIMQHTTDDVLSHHFDGVEIYNHLALPRCFPRGEAHWEYLLEQNHHALCLAVDDAHNCGDEVRQAAADGSYQPWLGGWIMVNAPSPEIPDIWRAIKSGEFYSSTGPQFNSIKVTEQEVYLETSPICRAWLRGPSWSGEYQQAAQPFCEATFSRSADWPYMRLVIEDEHGRQAWTNTLLSEDTSSPTDSTAARPC